MIRSLAFFSKNERFLQRKKKYERFLPAKIRGRATGWATTCLHRVTVYQRRPLSSLLSINTANIIDYMDVSGLVSAKMSSNY
jgi:hypothetical protein